MQENVGRASAPQSVTRSINQIGARLADVSAEIAAAGASDPSPQRESRKPIKANNLGLIGVTVTCNFSGREMDLPVSLELYEDLDPQALQAYLAEEARRMGACEPISDTHRVFVLPDSY
jgi:hypothetical protein